MCESERILIGKGMMTMTEVQMVPVALIAPGDNDREEFAETALRELADSIAQHGLAQPITVRPSDGGYQIVAGERRWRAVRLLGWKAIPALVRELSDETASAIMLLENIQRAELNPIEEARAYRKRMMQFGWNAAQTARAANVPEERVRMRLMLLSFAPGQCYHFNAPFKHSFENALTLAQNHARCQSRISPKCARVFER